MTIHFIRTNLFVFGAFVLLLSGCRSDGLDSPEQVVERAEALCECDSKECVDRITEEITEHTDRVEAVYPKKADVPPEMSSAISESRKVMLGCMQKLDQFSRHRAPERATNAPAQ